MQIIKYLDLFVGALINMIFLLFIIYKVTNLKIRRNKNNVIFNILIAAIFISIINIFNKDFYKLFLTLPFVVFCIKNVFDLDFKNSFLFYILCSIYSLVGETIAALFLSTIPMSTDFILNNIIGATIGAIIVIVFTMPLLFIKKLNKIIDNIVFKMNDNKKTIITIITLFLMGTVIYINISNLNNILNIFINIGVILVFVTILYMYYLENIKSRRISENYNIMLNYIEKYEKELIEKRKIIHDFRNQLIVINGFVDEKKKLKEYLNEIIKEQKEMSNNPIIDNIDKLPNGIKGLIYYKLNHIDKDIIVNINVKNNLKKFDKLPVKLSKNVLKAIGILLDNSIEAVINEEKKYINIELSFIKNIFVFKIINSCSNEIKLNSLQLGYSTKGNNRGYGISIIKDIIKKNEDIIFDINIENNEFIATIKVEIKNQ